MHAKRDMKENWLNYDESVFKIDKIHYNYNIIIQTSDTISYGLV